MRNFALKLFSAICLTIFLGQPAFAAYITDWNYTLSYSFSDYSNQYGNQFALSLDGTGTELSWGFNGTSSIGFINESGTVATNGSDLIEDHLYHNNQPIDSRSAILQSGTLTATLTLQGIGATSGGTRSFSTDLDFLFFETINQASPSSAAINNDVFILKNPENASATFSYEGYDYTFSFTSGFSALNNAYLDTTDMSFPGYYKSVYDLLHDPSSAYYYTPASNTYIGWTTTENALTEIDSLLTITAETTPVPEPSTFAFFGLGIATLAFVGRRMRRQ